MGIIAIIDDGINKEEVEKRVYSYTVFQNKIVYDEYVPEIFSHGTICAKIIEKKGRVDFFYSIRILDKDGLGNIEKLCLALEWLADKEVDFINLSIGIVNYIERNQEYTRLWKICKLLVYSNKKIIAARSNLEVSTIPADFSFVISVSNLSNKYSKANIRAIGSAKLLLKNAKIKEKACNSYACALVTAILSKYENFVPLCFYRRFRYNYKNRSYKHLPCTKKYNVTIPVVTFIGELKECVNVRRYLVPEFQMRGYRVSCVSNIKHSYLYNINFIPLLTKRKIRGIQNIEYPNIVLTFEKNKNSNSDVNIEIISEDRYKINSNVLCCFCKKANLLKCIIRIFN